MIYPIKFAQLCTETSMVVDCLCSLPVNINMQNFLNVSKAMCNVQHKDVVWRYIFYISISGLNIPGDLRVINVT